MSNSKIGRRSTLIKSITVCSNKQTVQSKVLKAYSN